MGITIGEKCCGAMNNRVHRPAGMIVMSGLSYPVGLATQAPASASQLVPDWQLEVCLMWSAPQPIADAMLGAKVSASVARMILVFMLALLLF
jgi:hypothetical protein